MAVDQSQGPGANAQGPEMKTLTPGTTYAWCSRGQSTNQPWCNGAHRGSDKQPVVFEVDSEKPVALCSCKKTKNPPYCVGSHVR
ncbi:CDGSH iron-sulfur domain-containing protein [Flavobacteriales bacterium]|nr:CDGSH iron-sulfur domain-containing protein [Flavobacteriales bacterium]